MYALRDSLLMLLFAGLYLALVMLLAAGAGALYKRLTGPPTMTPIAPDLDPAYFTALFDDELTLAKLLRHGDLSVPSKLTPNAWIFGTSHGERGLDARLGRGPLPRWRRDWSAAGPLIGRCELHVNCGDNQVDVYIGPPLAGEVEFSAAYADFPTKDDTIRFAICKAAIAFLTAERSRP